MTATRIVRLTHHAQLRMKVHQHHNFDTAGLGAGAAVDAEAEHFHMVVIAIAHLSVTAGCPRPLPSLLPPVLAERVPGFLLLPLLLFGRFLTSKHCLGLCGRQPVFVCRLQQAFEQAVEARAHLYSAKVHLEAALWKCTGWLSCKTEATPPSAMLSTTK